MSAQPLAHKSQKIQFEIVAVLGASRPVHPIPADEPGTPLLIGPAHEGSASLTFQMRTVHRFLIRTRAAETISD